MTNSEETIIREVQVFLTKLAKYRKVNTESQSTRDLHRLELHCGIVTELLERRYNAV